jgi:hypothetical protein
MFHTLSYQLYTYEHGRTAAEQRAADTRVGEVTAEWRDLRLRLGRVFCLGRFVQLARRAAGAMTGSEATASVQALSSYR